MKQFLLFLVLSCFPFLVFAQNTLPVTGGTPVLDGVIDTGEWTSDILTTARGVTIQSMTDGEYFYVVASWADTTESIDKKLWEYDGESWTQSGNEDRLGIVWDMGLNGGDGANCTTMCHGDGLMRTNNGIVDAWHWKAARGNGMGVVDDKVWKTDDRHSDPGRSAYGDNLSQGSGYPTFMATGDPGIDANFLTDTQDAFDAFDPFALMTAHIVATAVPFDSNLTFATGAKIPGYMHRIPDGDRASVQAAGKYDSGVWTVEFKRVLAGTVNDFTVTPGSSVDFTIDTFDNEGGSHASDGVDATVYTLDFSSIPVIKTLTLTNGTPTLDGVIDTGEWSSSAIVTPKGITIYSMADNDYFYLAASWIDATATESIDKNLWEYNGASWSQSGNEDRLGIIWDMGLNGSDGANCTTMCHGDGLMRTNNGNVDAWHWKAARGNGMGVVDDKVWKTDDRHSDPGTSAYSDNLSQGSGYPTFMGTGDPGIDANFLTDTQDALDVFDPFELMSAHTVTTAVPFDSNLTFTTGAKIPGYLHRIPDGDRASVQAAGKYDNGVWTVEFKRVWAGNDNDFTVTQGSSVDFTIDTFDNEGGSHASDGVDATVYTLNFSDIVTSIVTDGDIQPRGYALSQNYPNPFNPTTTINFTIQKTGKVELKLYDLLGREVVVLVNRTMSPGTYNATLDGAKLSSGVYFYRLVAGNGQYTQVKKMMLIK